MIAAYASMKRIQTFLALDEKRVTSLSAPGDNEKTVATPLGKVSTEEGLTEKMAISGGSFAWLKDSQPVLEDIVLDLRAGKLHMLVGSVASVSFTILVLHFNKKWIGSVSLIVRDFGVCRERRHYWYLS